MLSFPPLEKSEERYLSFSYIILKSLAKVMFFSDIRKQFITFFNEKSIRLPLKTQKTAHFS